MGRLFEEHIIRATKSLDGAWRFRADPGNIGESQKCHIMLHKSFTVNLQITSACARRIRTPIFQKFPPPYLRS